MVLVPRIQIMFRGHSESIWMHAIILFKLLLLLECAGPQKIKMKIEQSHEWKIGEQVEMLDNCMANCFTKINWNMGLANSRFANHLENLQNKFANLLLRGMLILLPRTTQKSFALITHAIVDARRRLKFVKECSNVPTGKLGFPHCIKEEKLKKHVFPHLPFNAMSDENFKFVDESILMDIDFHSKICNNPVDVCSSWEFSFVCMYVDWFEKCLSFIISPISCGFALHFILLDRIIAKRHQTRRHKFFICNGRLTFALVAQFDCKQMFSLQTVCNGMVKNDQLNCQCREWCSAFLVHFTQMLLNSIGKAMGKFLECDSSFHHLQHFLFLKMVHFFETA